jgi:predicted NBD/HSP70 family sugar kinase
VAFAIAAIVAILDPGLVVLGGSIGSEPGFAEPVRRHVADVLVEPPRICTSELGDRAPLLGAVAVAVDHAREQLLREVRRTVSPAWQATVATSWNGVATVREEAG